MAMARPENNYILTSIIPFINKKNVAAFILCKSILMSHFKSASSQQSEA